MSSTAITAIAGIVGVMLGGLIQAFLIRANTSVDRQRTYDQRRFEKRSELYLRVLNYVDHLEHASGRGFSNVEYRKRKGGSAKRARRELQSLAVELKIYGSWITALQFSSWKMLHSEHLMAEALRDGLAAAGEIDESFESALSRCEQLITVTSNQAGESASNLARQVQEELIGTDLKGISYRIRKWRRQREKDSRKGAVREHIDREFAELSELFRDFSNEALAQPGITAKNTGAAEISTI